MSMKQWLVGGWATPLKNMSSSIGMMTATQYFWENKIDVPNHQPVNQLLISSDEYETVRLQQLSHSDMIPGCSLATPAWGNLGKYRGDMTNDSPFRLELTCQQWWRSDTLPMIITWSIFDTPQPNAFFLLTGDDFHVKQTLRF